MLVWAVQLFTEMSALPSDCGSIVVPSLSDGKEMQSVGRSGAANEAS